MSNMRLVILGFRDAGKSSAGNTILGGQHFYSKKTVQRVKGEGDVDDRHVTIIKAPGWGKDQLLKDTAELMKEEMTLSVSLCPPGPHAVLLVIRAGMKFTETSRRAAQEHVELLGERVWSHTIVLFTHGDWLGERSIEQYIESEGRPLQWLVEICGNRYHVFSNETTKVQVSELFHKVEETVAGNSGNHYEIDGTVLREVEERKAVENKRAELMKNKFQEKRDVLTSTGRDAKTSTVTVKSKTTMVSKDLRIVLLGHSNAGMSSVGNGLLGSEKFDSDNALQAVRKECKVSGRQITVVNTPGWGPEQRLSDTPELTRQEIILSVSHCNPGPHVLVLVIRVGKTFTELNRRAVQDHMDLLGAKVWEHTVVVMKCGGGLDNVSVEQYIEREGKALHWLVEKCGNSYCVLDNNKKSENELLKVVDSMVQQNGGTHYEMEKEVLQEVQKNKKGEVERAKERENKVRKQWEALKMSEGLEKMTIGDNETTTAKKSIHLPLKELRIVLLGHRGAGKTAAGNTILGSEAFHTKQSVQSIKKEAPVAKRHVTVIRASDWEKEQLLMDTPELTKQEIKLSLSMCPPGPHAILVVVSVVLKFTEANRRAVQEHLELLSEKAWKHCVVLFTCEEWLGDITIEQYIESEGKPLQWLIEKCGDRYHVLNIKNRKESSQIPELLQKIEYMMTGYGGSHYQPDSDTISKLENLRKMETERANERKMTVTKYRQELKTKLKQGNN